MIYSARNIPVINKDEIGGHVSRMGDRRHGQTSDTPHFQRRFEFCFLYSCGQLCAGVRLLEGLFLLGGFLQVACFIVFQVATQKLKDQDI
jgi:hypothetical protein